MAECINSLRVDGAYRHEQVSLKCGYMNIWDKNPLNSIFYSFSAHVANFAPTPKELKMYSLMKG